jgi:hypothetical protein
MTSTPSTGYRVGFFQDSDEMQGTQAFITTELADIDDLIGMEGILGIDCKVINTFKADSQFNAVKSTSVNTMSTSQYSSNLSFKSTVSCKKKVLSFKRI